MSFLLTMMKQAVVAIIKILHPQNTKRGYKYIIIIMLMLIITIEITKINGNSRMDLNTNRAQTEIKSSNDSRSGNRKKEIISCCPILSISFNLESKGVEELLFCVV